MKQINDIVKVFKTKLEDGKFDGRTRDEYNNNVELSPYVYYIIDDIPESDDVAKIRDILTGYTEVVEIDRLYGNNKRMRRMSAIDKLLQ